MCRFFLIIPNLIPVSLEIWRIDSPFPLKFIRQLSRLDASIFCSSVASLMFFFAVLQNQQEFFPVFIVFENYLLVDTSQHRMLNSCFTLFSCRSCHKSTPEIFYNMSWGIVNTQEPSLSVPSPAHNKKSVGSYFVSVLNVVSFV